MPVNLPAVRAASPHRMVTLGELRELVEAAAGLSPDIVVRGRSIPFKTGDLGHPVGLSLTSLGLDHPPTEVEPRAGRPGGGR